MQQLTILGNVGRDAVVRETNGRRAIGFSVACNEKYTDNSGQKVERTTWYDCTIWRESQQSAKISEFLKKGQQVLIQGKPSVRTYRNQQNETVAALDVRVDAIELVGGKKEDKPVVVNEPRQSLGSHRDANPPQVASGDDNDLPF